MSVQKAIAYGWEQCTQFVYRTTEWIPTGLGNAGEWVDNAPSHGLVVVHKPVVGSVAVWRKTSGAGAWGHVADVIGIQSNGLPIVREENYLIPTIGNGPGPGHTFGVDTRNVNAASASNIIGYLLPKNGTNGQTSFTSDPSPAPTPSSSGNSHSPPSSQESDSPLNAIGHMLVAFGIIIFGGLIIYTAVKHRG